MLTAALSFFLGMYFVQIGLSGTQIGIIFALSTVTSILTILPSGFSNDKFKSKYLIAISLLFIAIQYYGMAETTYFPTLLALFLIGGIGATLYSASADSIFHKSTKKKNINKKIGIFQGLHFLTIGIGMITAGYLLEIDFQFLSLFKYLSFGFIALAITSIFILPKSVTTELDLVAYKKDLFSKKVILFMLIVFLFAIHFGAESTSYGLFVKETLGLSPLYMGLYMGVPIITMGLTALIIAKNIHRWKATNILLFGLFVSGSGHILMTLGSPLVSMLFRTYHEVGDAAWFFFLYLGVNKLFDLKRIGGNASIFILVTTMGSTLGALATGPLGEHYGYDIALIVTGITTLIAFTLALQFKQHFDHN